MIKWHRCTRLVADEQRMEPSLSRLGSTLKNVHAWPNRTYYRRWTLVLVTHISTHSHLLAGRNTSVVVCKTRDRQHLETRPELRAVITYNYEDVDSNNKSLLLQFRDDLGSARLSFPYTRQPWVLMLGEQSDLIRAHSCPQSYSHAILSENSITRT